MVRARTSVATATKPAPAAPKEPSPPASTAATEQAVEAVSVEKCVNCRFYDRRNRRPLDGKAPLWGQCRRHAPRLNPVTAKAYVVEGIWPLVRDDDWCGEWKIIMAMAEELPAEPGAQTASDLPPATPPERLPEAALGD